MLYKLILAHLVADFVLQFAWLVIRKRRWDGLAIHTGIVFLTMAAVAWNELARWWPWLVLIAAVHAVSDWGKIRLEPRLGLPPILPFLADQVVHLAAITAAVILADRTTFQALGLASLLPGPAEMAWLIASVYIVCTFAASIALPIWLDPACLAKRSGAWRLATIVTAAVVLTLSWKGLNLVIPIVALGLYQLGARRLARTPATGTLGIEVLSATVLAASLGGVLR